MTREIQGSEKKRPPVAPGRVRSVAEAVHNPYDFGNKWSVPAIVKNGVAVRLDGKPRWQELLRRKPDWW